MSDLTTKKNGSEIVWQGHLCEGTQFIPDDKNTFCLWTRCGDHDVPANTAHQGDITEVHCTKCIEVWNEENGQFGVGA